MFAIRKQQMVALLKNPVKFLFWSMAVVIGLPISLGILVAVVPMPFSTYPTYDNPGVVPGVNLKNYKRLESGMAYEEVVGILGEDGTEVSSAKVGEYETTLYKWEVGGFSVANMVLSFRNGKLAHKAQFELP